MTRQRTSGHLAGLGRSRTLSRGCRAIEYGPSPTCKPYLRGVDTCQRLSFLIYGKAVGGQARVRTGFGKSDRPGSQGGPGKRGEMDGAKRARTAETPKQPSSDLSPARALALSRPPNPPCARMISLHRMACPRRLVGGEYEARRTRPFLRWC